MRFDLINTEAGHDKEYHAELTRIGNPNGPATPVTGLYEVRCQYGRRGHALQAIIYPKTGPVEHDAALAIFTKLEHEKRAKGYRDASGKPPMSQVAPGIPDRRSPAVGLPAPSYQPEELIFIETAQEAAKYVDDDDYLGERKFDGHHVGIVRRPDGIFGFNKLGQLKPLPGEIVAELLKVPCEDFAIAGEKLGTRLAIYNLSRFGGDMSERPYRDRRLMMERGFCLCDPAVIEIAEAWEGRDAKLALVEREYAGNGEGVVFNKASAPYRPGRTQHLKFKFYSTATFRVREKSAKDKAKGHNSIALELFDGKVWKQVGHASMNGKGRVPEPGEYVECRYLYAVKTEDRRGFEVGIVQTEYLRTRDDVTDADCNFTQLRYRQEPGKVN